MQHLRHNMVVETVEPVQRHRPVSIVPWITLLELELIASVRTIQRRHRMW